MEGFERTLSYLNFDDRIRIIFYIYDLSAQTFAQVNNCSNIWIIDLYWSTDITILTSLANRFVQLKKRMQPPPERCECVLP